MENKRKITPHKGGRNAAFRCSRITKETRGKLDEILERRGLSAADWVTEKIEQEYALISASTLASRSPG